MFPLFILNAVLVVQTQTYGLGFCSKCKTPEARHDIEGSMDPIRHLILP